MKRRIPGAVALLAVAAIGLSACDTKVGEAAIVGKDRISDSQVTAFVTDKAVPFDNQGTELIPRSFVLETWILGKLFEQAADDRGGPITTAELDDARSQILGSTPMSQVRKLYTSKGFTTKFVDVLLDERANFFVVGKRLSPKASDVEVLQSLQGTLATKIVAVVDKYAKHVSVSGRYGAWDAKNLSVDGAPGAGLPGFVTFGPGATGDTAQ